MSAEDLDLHALRRFRRRLVEALRDSVAWMELEAWDRDPEARDALLEKLAEIREYLDKTREEKEILEIAERYIYRPTDFEEYNKELREKGFKERTPPEAKQGDR